MKRSKQVVNVQSIGIDLPPLKAKFGGGREAPNLLLTTSLEGSLAASPHRRLPPRMRTPALPGWSIGGEEGGYGGTRIETELPS